MYTFSLLKHKAHTFQHNSMGTSELVSFDGLIYFQGTCAECSYDMISCHVILFPRNRTDGGSGRSTRIEGTERRELGLSCLICVISLEHLLGCTVTHLKKIQSTCESVFCNDNQV